MAKVTKKNNSMLRLISAVVIIIIIAIIWIVLNWPVEGSPLGTTCYANQNFSCYRPVYYHSNGNLSLEISQSTNTIFYNARIVFIPDNTSYSSNISSFPWNTSDSTAINETVPTNQIVNITLPISGIVPVATYKYGAIWVSYKQSPNGTTYYAEIAKVTLEAA